MDAEWRREGGEAVIALKAWWNRNEVKRGENPRLTTFREYRALKDAAETRDQKMERRNRLARELWALDCELAGTEVDRMKRLLPLTLLLCALGSLPAHAATWFVRIDGGTLWNGSTGQCDGHGDAAYPGSGTNQHCAVSNYQYLYSETGSYVISGGDRVVIRGCAALPGEQNSAPPNCRIGPKTNAGGCLGGTCDPVVPSGSSGAHTIIEGGCAYDNNCNPVNVYPYTSNLAQLFGGFSLAYVLNLSGSSYVELDGIELTTHNGTCTRYGTPVSPITSCASSSPPLSDFASTGILTTNTTSHITLIDVYLHGFSASGIQGPIGGPFTLNRVIFAFNTFSGWNFGDDVDTPNGAGSSITQTQVMMIGNGFLEEYPIVSTMPGKKGYDTNNAGFGDSWSGQDTLIDSITCDQCTVAWNTKDGFIGPHTLAKNLSLTRSAWYGNMGSALKWGTQPGGSTIFENNLVITNCTGMSGSVPGFPAGFNSQLTGWCRADGAMFAIAYSGGSTFVAANNTLITLSNTAWQFSCVVAGTCADTNVMLTNNAYLGFTAPNDYFNENYGGKVPAIYESNDSPATDMQVYSTNQLFYGTRVNDCDSGYGGITLYITNPVCSDPQFVGETAQGGWPPESALYNFNFHPATGSPMIHAGTTPCPSVDYYGIAQTSPCTIGAAVEAGTPPSGGGININVIMSGGIF